VYIIASVKNFVKWLNTHITQQSGAKHERYIQNNW
jgi:hypothetical protein